MKCVICKHAETKPGTTTVTLERDGFTYVVNGVPAQVCPNCGEDYVNESVAGELLTTAEQMAKAGAQVNIRQYRAA
ncbi:MAG: type II toxin-antitoxin system MqsA family antitoxin [Deltaproteobacteria bacterium]|nr:type II toxin-antitoxin system MqsA family antitoxin [Deltaproteobacteria bacterium]